MSPESRWRLALSQFVLTSLARINWLPVFLVLAAMVAGGALRLYDIGDLPRGFSQDEAVYSYDAYSLTKSGRDHLGHPLNLIAFETYGDWTPPVQTILMTPAAALFGLDITALRAWNALLALMAVPVIYLLAKLLFSLTWIAVTAAWTIALLPWHVAESRWIHPSSIVPVVTALLMYALAKAAKERDGTWFVIAAVFAALGLATYQSLRAYAGILIAAAVVAWWRWYRAIPLRTIFLAGAIIGAIAVPTYVFLLLDEAGGMRFREVSVFTENSFYLPAGTDVDAGFLARQYVDYFLPDFLIREDGDYYPQVLPRGVGVLPIAVVAMALAGVIGLITRAVRPVNQWQRSVAVFLLIAIVLYPLPGAVSVPSPASVRVIHGMPVIVLVAVFGVSWLYSAVFSRIKWVPGIGRRATLAIAAGVLGILFVAQSAQQLDRYFSNYADQSASDFHDGFEEAVNFALRNQQLYDEIWVAHVNEPYIYLLFQGEMDPAEARERYTVLRDPNGYNWITRLDNFWFTARIWHPPPADIPVLAMDTVFQSHYPDGEVAYEIRTGEVPDRGLVMLIYRPAWL